MSDHARLGRVGRGTAALCGLALCAGTATLALPAAADEGAAAPAVSATPAASLSTDAAAGRGTRDKAAARSGVAAAPAAQARALLAPKDTTKPSAGAAGIGDPDYPDYGNGGYDVAHYGIDVAVTPATGLVSGTTTIQATATQALSSFNLDLVLKASSVTVDGKKATFTQPTQHELVVTPERPIAKGKKMTVVVTYAGEPAKIKINDVTGWVATSDGAVLMGEPEGAAWWYPANDHPRDKATFDIDLTVPKGMQGLSVGRLKGTDHGETTDTWHWSSREPMATYGPFAAVGHYDIAQGTSSQGIPWLNAAVKADRPESATAAKDMARVPEVVDWLTGQFGAYPFDAMGSVVFDADFYALETFSRPLYPLPMWKEGSYVSLVVHEQAHQWFGDSVSVRNWRDIWLNEGFATWTEWRWEETHGGPAASTAFKTAYDKHAADDEKFWGLVLTNPGVGHEFDPAVYQRGAMAVQALRTKIGDQRFDALLRGWLGRHRHCDATVQEFIDYAGQVSGQDLKAFFAAWLSTPGKPKPSAELGFPAEMIPAG